MTMVELEDKDWEQNFDPSDVLRDINDRFK